jgi:hypothetical protein
MATSAASPSAIAAAATPRPSHGFVSHAEWARGTPRWARRRRERQRQWRTCLFEFCDNKARARQG